MDPENAHARTLNLMQLAGAIQPIGSVLGAIFRAPDKPVRVFGLQFSNPVGLAAGYDKDASAWRGLASLGFGHIEVGTITPRPQPGNPKPRLFRLPEERALINRMGFPGEGAETAARNLAGRRPEGIVLGANLGMNKDTPLESAVDDYLDLVDHFADLADYLAINVSSPNTVGLRRLQARRYLEQLLGAVIRRRDELLGNSGEVLPILVKLAPDLDDAELDDALAAILSVGADGVIATNTTVERHGIRSQLAAESGGLSGAPLHPRSVAIVSEIYRRTGGRLPIVGVGGIMSTEDAHRMLDAGASLVQIYTGLVYRGPGLVKEILAGL
jgi:dihydroorotate dehydrogenase